MNRIFDVRLTREAMKDRESLQPLWREKATRALLKLEDNPYAGDRLSKNLRPVRALKFSLPGGEYRAAYLVLPEEGVCLVFLLAPRENFYELALRRFDNLRKQGVI